MVVDVIPRGSQNQSNSENGSGSEERIYLHRVIGCDAVTTNVLPLLGHTIHNMFAFLYVIPISSNFYRKWKLIMNFVEVCKSFIAPFQLAFFSELKPWFVIFNIVTGVILFIDLVISLCLAHGNPAPDQMIVNWRTMSHGFVMRWRTWIDFFSVIPWEVFSGIRKHTGWLRVLVLVLHRLKFVGNSFTRWEKNKNYSYLLVRCAWLLYITLFIVNLSGCVFYYIASHYTGEDPTWFGDKLIKKALWERYLISVYWSITTFSTVGYGDWVPVNGLEQAFTVIFMTVNLFLGAYVGGSISVLLDQVSAKTRDHRKKLETVSSFMKRNEFTSAIQQEILSHISIEQRTNTEGLQVEDFLRIIPKSLQCEVKRRIYAPLLKTTYLFHDASDEFIRQLAYISKVENYGANETVIFGKEGPSMMYMVIGGDLELITSQGNVHQTLSNGGLFGEIGVLCRKQDLFTVRTRTNCQLLRMSEKKYLNIHRANIESGARVMHHLFQNLRTQQMENILEETRNVLSYSLDGRVNLHFAICEKDNELLVRLLECGADPNQPDENGRTALHIAVTKDSVSCVAHLIRHKADFNRKDRSGKSPLQIAMDEQKESIVQVILNEIEPQSKDIDQFIVTTIDSGHLDIFSMVCDMDLIDGSNLKDYDTTALHRAVLNKNEAVIRELILHGYSPKRRDIDGNSSFDLAKGNDYLTRMMKSFGGKVTEPKKKASCENPCSHCTVSA